MEAMTVNAENSGHTDAPVWDEHALDELREIGGDELVKRVVRQSIREAEERIAELSGTCLEAKASTWREAAHALHGVALSIGAIRLSQIVAEALHDEKLEHVRNHTVDFAQYLSDVREALAVFLV
jgi:HPt (histidine-containing phosphotransfer) domain-containing protein